MRLYVGNGGPNLVSSFHVIGEIFDKVWFEGGTHFQENVQTTLIPAGGAAIDGLPPRGAGQLRARRPLDLPRLQQGRARDPQGRWRREQGDLFRQGSRRDATSATARSRTWPPVADGRAPRSAGDADASSEQVEAGKALFAGTCSACHQANGEGMAGVFPPLAKSDYLAADPKRVVGVVLHGLTGPVKVNGKDYNSVMPPMSQLTDDEVANISTYVLNSWGNPGGKRDQGRSRAAPQRPRRADGAAH